MKQNQKVLDAKNKRRSEEDDGEWKTLKRRKTTSRSAEMGSSSSESRDHRRHRKAQPDPSSSRSQSRDLRRNRKRCPEPSSSRSQGRDRDHRRHRQTKPKPSPLVQMCDWRTESRPLWMSLGYLNWILVHFHGDGGKSQNFLPFARSQDLTHDMEKNVLHWTPPNFVRNICPLFFAILFGLATLPKQHNLFTPEEPVL
eukprot:TRINITY_DN325_c0_g1_i3.p1 TRINITY_DN325_c0_g1~~TRINITY_DN325_c0_g1_i3.p1  ORF type:complete len:217 (+),score=28.43 TRINITY_DN325_c0_g1_i3:60-653(+)